jgi:hypothetical protein
VIVIITVGEETGIEKLRNFHMVTQLASVGAGIRPKQAPIFFFFFAVLGLNSGF